MAKLYGEIAAKALLTLDKSFARANGQPLDASEVYYSLAAAEEYAAGAQAYIGQKIVVVEGGVVTHYSIEDAAGTLKELGSKPIGDETSITVAEDGTVSLKGVGALVFERDVLDAEGQPTGTKEDVQYQPLMTKAGLVWVEPSKTTVEGLATLIEALTARVKANEDAIQANADAIKAISDDYLVEADKTALSEAIAGEKTRAEAAEKANADAIQAIADDYLKTADKYDDTELAGRVTTIENDYLKTADKYDDTELAGRVSTIEGDYLKAADIADMATDSEVAAAVKEEADRAKGVEEDLQTQINTIMNNPDTEGVINSINEFTKYIEDHGEIADGFRVDINKNKDDIAAEAERATDAEETLSGRLDVLEAIDHDAYIAADTALENKLTAEINKKANSEDVNASISGLDTRIAANEAALAANGSVAQAIAAAEGRAAEDATTKANAAKEAAINDAASKYATTGALSALETAVDERLDALEEYDHSTYATKDELKTTDDKAVSNANAITNLTGRLDGIVAQGGEPNVINNIKVNGVVQEIVDKAVDIDVPTKFSDLSDDSGFSDRIDAAKKAGDDAQSTANSAVSAAAAAQGDVDALEGEVGALQTTVAGHTSSISDYGTRIGVLEQADVTHATEYNELKTIVTGHTGDIAKMAKESDLNAAIARIAANEGTLTTLTETTIPGINEELGKKANASALNSYYTKTEITGILGEVTEGKTLVELINEAKTEATYDDTGIKALISAEEARAKKAEADLTEEIGKTNAAVAALMESDDGVALNSIKELAFWIETHGEAATGMATAIEDNAKAIAAINDEDTGILALAKSYTDTQILAIPVASDEEFGLMKVDNTSLSATAGVVSVKAVSTDLLTQGTEELILNGGTAV